MVSKSACTCYTVLLVPEYSYHNIDKFLSKSGPRKVPLCLHHEEISHVSEMRAIIRSASLLLISRSLGQ